MGENTAGQSLAAYGAIVATAAFIWNLVDYLLQRPRLRVRIGRGFHRQRSENSLKMIIVTATNIGSLQLIIQECGLLTRRRKILKMPASGSPRERGMSEELPCSLATGESFVFWFTMEDLDLESLREPFVAYVRDSLDRHHLARGKEAPFAVFLLLREWRIELSRLWASLAHKTKRALRRTNS